MIPMLVLTLAALLASPPATAAAIKKARLSLHITVEGQERWQGGGHQAETRISQSLRFATTLTAEGGPSAHNRMAPAAASPMATVYKPQDMQALQTQVQQIQARCKGDQSCLMREAGKLDMARFASLGAPPGPQAGGSADSDPPDRYLDYLGLPGCQATLEARIDEQTQGRSADINGPVPYTHSRSGQASGAVDMQIWQCQAHDLVLDLQERRLLSMTGIHLPALRGEARYKEGSRQTQEKLLLGLHPVAAQWLAEQTRALPQRGETQARLPLSGSDGGRGQRVGELLVRLSWRFDEL